MLREHHFRRSKCHHLIANEALPGEPLKVLFADHAVHHDEPRAIGQNFLSNHSRARLQYLLDLFGSEVLPT